jgi:hypothetical protein
MTKQLLLIRLADLLNEGEIAEEVQLREDTLNFKLSDGSGWYSLKLTPIV